MTTLRSIAGILVAFVLGILLVEVGPKVWEAQLRPGLVRIGLLSPGEPKIPDCNAAERACAKRYAEEAARFERVGLAAAVEPLHRKAAFDGDARSAFMAGWIHEEAYRGAVGERLRSHSPLPELESTDEEDLPRGPGFVALVEKAEREAGTANERHRRLAYLFYLRAAIDGFAPAMNNLGSMFQFGLTGVRERASTEIWYERAAGVGNPVAVLNLIRMRIRDLRDGSVSCETVRRTGAVAVVKTRSALTDDRDPDILDRTRFRGRKLPDDLKSLALDGPGPRLRRLIDQAGITRPAISQAELRGLMRDLPEGWAFDGDPDENETEMPRFRREADVSTIASTCARTAWRRSGQSDASKMRQLRALQDSYDRPRRYYGGKWY